METTPMGYIGVIQGHMGLSGGYMGILEKKMETTIMGLLRPKVLPATLERWCRHRCSERLGNDP